MRSAISLWAPVAGWMGLIFYLSSLSSLPSLPSGFPQEVAYIAAHMTEYAVLALLLHRALGRPGSRKRLAIILLIAILYGLSDEVHQMFVPSRSSSLWDVAVDALGAGIALGVLRAWFY
ncbi:MAG: VanZ family protein [Dehalococcoidia bacterium]|nr:VanZ family protein [Dehalococcoidia bacterium]